MYESFWDLLQINISKREFYLQDNTLCVILALLDNNRLRVKKMRFIHTADIHLGVVPDEDKPWSKTRAAEVTATFDKLLAIAEERQVDLLLIAGDLFHTPPTEAMLRDVDHKLSKLSVTRTVIIAGNHDYMAKGSPAENYEFQSNTVLMPGDAFSNAYLEDINTCVTGFSFGQEEYTEDLISDMTPQVDGAVNILLAHGGDAEHMPMDFRKLAKAGFDYCALGHIHKPKHMVKNKMAYSGSLEPIDSTEIGRRGFIYGQCKNGETRIKWEALNCRSYVNLGFEIKPEYSGDKIIDVLNRQMQKMGEENIYKIILSGSMGSGVKPEYDVLRRRFHIYDIVDNALCEYSMDKLLEDNEDNLLGKFIQRFSDEEDEMSKKALQYGVEAILQTGEK